MSDSIEHNQTTPAKNAHTPGPWTVDEFRTRNGPTYFISRLWLDWNDGGEMHTDEIAEIQMDYRGGAALANARLIAAAPDLLKACGHARETVGGMADQVLDPPDNVLRRLTSELSAAIAKAEGRAAP